MHHADLEWDEHGAPRSSRFDDVYFSRAGGLAESEYVFLAHNDLPHRFRSLHAGDSFTIAETGFGTGLNFLLAWRQFDRDASADATLHYLSAEAFPLSPADLTRALALWPELADYAAPLLAQYPPAVPGFHRLVLAGGRVRLTLMFDDATSAYGSTYSDGHGRVDAWFLDGFSPDKNPEMWRDALFREMARLSKPDASFATFSAAGFVRRGLQNAGFTVVRAKGFGRKREMLCGRISGQSSSQKTPPWYAWPRPEVDERHAIVLGGGLAGTSTARALAERGWRVTLIERHAALAQEASGNLAGALYPHLHSQYTPATRLFLSSYLYALRHIARLRIAGHAIPGENAGVALLAHDDERAASWRALLDGLQLPASVLRPLVSDDLAPLSFDGSGLFFPEGGWLNPPALCRAHTTRPEITTLLTREVLHWERHHGLWHVRDALGVTLAQAPVLILATGSASYGQSWSQELPLGKVRGQVSHVAATEQSRQLKTVLCYEGYFTPAYHGQHCLGASFERGVEGDDVTEKEHTENWDKLSRVLPEFAGSLAAPISGRVAHRLSCRDHLPIVGPLPDFAAFRDDFHDMARGFAPGHYPAARWQDGLYLNIAHGSRGLTTAPLCAELLAAQICGEALPLPSTLAEALSPARFLVRELQKPSKTALR